MDVNMPPSSAMEATKYSKYVSLMGVKALEHSINGVINEEPNTKNCNGCNCKNEQGWDSKLIERLCYACQHIIQDLVRICYLIKLEGIYSPPYSIYKVLTTIIKIHQENVILNFCIINFKMKIINFFSLKYSNNIIKT